MRDQQSPPAFTLTPSFRGWRGALLLIMVVAAPLWHLHIINREMPSTHSDLVPVWVGVRALLHHQNPYTDTVTRQAQITYYGRALSAADHVNKMGFAYPATTGIVLAALAPLDWIHARLAFLCILPVLTALGTFAWIRVSQLQLSHVPTIFLTLGVLFSWPVIWALRLQQPSLLVAALVATGCLSLQRGKGSLAGVLLALAMIKPQIVGPLILWLLVWAVFHRSWPFVCSFAISMGALLAAAQKLCPAWVSPWRAAGIDLLSYTHQAPALQTMFGDAVGMVLMFVFALTSVWILWKLRSCAALSVDFAMAISLALSATVCLMPTDPPMIYNDVFLFPPLLMLICSNPEQYYVGLARRIVLGLLIWTFAAPVLAVLGETLRTPSALWDGLPFQNGFLPIAVCIGLTANLLQTVRSSKENFGELARPACATS